MIESLPKLITIGDKYGPAMKVQTKEEATEYLEVCIKHAMLFGGTVEEAKAVELQNIGYYAGYYDPETRKRIYELYNTMHPIFGSSTPSAGEALQIGVDMVKEADDAPQP